MKRVIIIITRGSGGGGKRDVYTYFVHYSSVRSRWGRSWTALAQPCSLAVDLGWSHAVRVHGTDLDRRPSMAMYILVLVPPWFPSPLTLEIFLAGTKEVIT